MKKRQPLISQADATRLLRAARAAGYPSARITVRPDGTVEVDASEAQPVTAPQDDRSWDVVFK